MVSFLRDVMIVVAIVASLFALYPGQEPTSHSAAHSLPAGDPPAAVAASASDGAGVGFEKRP